MLNSSRDQNEGTYRSHLCRSGRGQKGPLCDHTDPSYYWDDEGTTCCIFLGIKMKARTVVGGGRRAAM